MSNQMSTVVSIAYRYSPLRSAQNIYGCSDRDWLCLVNETEDIRRI